MESKLTGWPPNDVLTSVTDIVFLMLDRQANIIDINPYGCQLLEYPAEKLIGKNWIDYCIPKAQQESVRVVFQQIVDGERQVDHYENSLVSQSGKEYVLTWHNMERRDKSGNIAGTLSSGIDITERVIKERQTQEALLLAQRKCQAILDNAIEAIIGTDMKGNIISFNNAAEVMFGYLSGEILGQNIRQLMPAPHRQNHDGFMHHYLTTGEAKIIGSGRELTAVKKDGSSFPIHICVTDTIIENEHIFTGLLRDLSKQKAVEQQLQEKETENHQHRERLAHIARVATLGEITAGIAHEVNQPLAAIATYAQSARRLTNRDTGDIDELNYVLEQIERQAVRASQVIQRIRDLAKLGHSCRNVVQINDIIEDSLTLIAAEANAKQVALVCKLGADLPAVHVDAIQIQQVLLNLILNALQSMDMTQVSQRSITISSACTTDMDIRVTVSDTGSGISKEHRDQLFIPFFTTRKNGMGIGLSICRTLITAHGGSLNIGKPKPKGSEFYFILPATQPSKDAANG